MSSTEKWDESLSFALAMLGRDMRHLASERLACLGLHPGQHTIIQRLHETPGMTQAQLAGVLGVRQPTVAKMIRRMERGGLLRRARDVGDGRVSRLYTTEASDRLMPAIHRFRRELEESVTAALSPEEQEYAKGLIKKIHARIIASR